MVDLIKTHFSEIASFVIGLLGGGAIGSFVTIRINRPTRASGKSNIVNQSGSTAGGDIVGRDKTTEN